MGKNGFIAAALAVLLSLYARAGSAQIGDGLIGTWEFNEPLVGLTMSIILNADGSGALNGEPISYIATGDTLTIPEIELSDGFQFAVAGDRLTLSGGGMLDVPAEFVRKDAPAGARAARPAPQPGLREPRAAARSGTSPASGARAPKAASPKAAASPQPKPATPQAKPAAARMAPGSGVWVAEERSGDEQFPLTYTHYLTLLPDGVILLQKAEGAASASKVGLLRKQLDRVAAEGSAGLRSVGRWEAHAGELVIRFNAGNRQLRVGFIEGSNMIQLSGIGSFETDSPLIFKRQ